MSIQPSAGRGLAGVREVPPGTDSGGSGSGGSLDVESLPGEPSLVIAARVTPGRGHQHHDKLRSTHEGGGCHERWLFGNGHLKRIHTELRSSDESCEGECQDQGMRPTRPLSPSAGKVLASLLDQAASKAEYQR